MVSSGVTCDVQRLRYAADVADKAVESGVLPTGLIAVANCQETLWTHVSPSPEKVSLDTIFLLASISKPMVATAVMQLVEHGLLSLHRPVASYLPEFGAYGKQAVTTWHLLTHTSGLDETEFDPSHPDPPANVRSGFEMACGSYLHFEPGTRCEYCTLAFSVLAELVTRLSGKRYPDYMCEHVFEPLGMRHTAFRPVEPRLAASVGGFDEPGQTERFTAAEIAGGGIWSTAADMVAFGQSFLRGAPVLSPATIEAMTTLQTGGMVAQPNGKPVPFTYALGWSKPSIGHGAVGSERAFSHGGATSTLLHIDPEWNLVYVFLSNRWCGDPDVASRALWAVYSSLTRG